MDKREISDIFRQRLRELVARGDGSTAAFLRETGMDRSALSQFLNPASVRLPRTEALRQIAAGCGVSADWLLGLENAPEGRQTISSRLTVEKSNDGEVSVLEQWRKEADGHKLRYVPSKIPDMLNLQYESGEAMPYQEVADDLVGEGVLSGILPGEMDIEIAMPVQTLESLSEGAGLWKKHTAEFRRRQLVHMSRLCAVGYPELRLHLYDGTQHFSAPFTVFGRMRTAIYIGDAYLELTNRNEIRAFVRRFDELVRAAIVAPDQVSGFLNELSQLVIDGENRL